ncbi:MFS transporter [Candidatus Bathyarchaeota archaeon]|nr:MAG: MFS transporter [Candidatus Bathyarchaeota archaeon]
MHSESFAGVISDRIASRKPLVIVGYALSTVAKPFFSVTSNFAEALAVRLTDRAGKGIRTSPRDALISDSVREAVSGRAFGLHRSLDQLGAIIGPILAFFHQKPIPHLTRPRLNRSSRASILRGRQGRPQENNEHIQERGKGSEPKVHHLSDRNWNLRYRGIQLFIRPCEGKRSRRKPGHRSTSLCDLERGNSRGWAAVRVAGRQNRKGQGPHRCVRTIRGIHYCEHPHNQWSCSGLWNRFHLRAIPRHFRYCAACCDSVFDCGRVEGNRLCSLLSSLGCLLACR